MKYSIVASMLIIAGCGGGGGNGNTSSSASQTDMCFETSLQNCGSGPWDPLGIALSLAWISGQCTEEVRCSADPVETDFDAGIVTNDFIATNWTPTSAVENEPNDNPAEATPFVIQANASVLITGALNDSTDPADFVALSFGPNDSINGYIAYLCSTPDDCIQPWFQGDEIYIDLLDQNQLVIQTTNMAATHFVSFQASQGVLYYVAVRALDTNGADFDYKLVITD